MEGRRERGRGKGGEKREDIRKDREKKEREREGEKERNKERERERKKEREREGKEGGRQGMRREGGREEGRERGKSESKIGEIYSNLLLVFSKPTSRPIVFIGSQRRNNDWAKMSPPTNGYVYFLLIHVRRPPGRYLADEYTMCLLVYMKPIEENKSRILS